VIDAIRDACWRRDHTGVLRLTPEGLYGRRKLTAHLRRGGLQVAECTVARCMKTLGHSGIRRAKRVRTTIPGKDGHRAGDLLNREVTAPAPNRVWVTDFVRTWAGFCYVAFIVDVFAHMIVAWHATTSKATELVMTSLRMALWQRGRDGHPAVPGELIHLRHHGEIQPEQKVLINGASGGVGTFAVQIAKSYGPEVTGVTSTQNIDLVRSLGADHVVDYTTTDFARGERRYDLILDTVGNRLVPDLRRALAEGGKVAVTGFTSGWYLLRVSLRGGAGPGGKVVVGVA
jgi:Zinc-binding dehydrogenase/Integrase core domain/HTH-like domain